LAAFAAAVESEPNDAGNQFHYGAALDKCERLEDAERHLSRAIDIDPAMGKAFVLLADVVRKMGNADKSVEVLATALALDPDNGEIHRLLGAAYQELGQVENALASYGKARAIQPDNAGVTFSLAGLLEMSNKLDQASEAVREGLKAAPDDFGLNLIAAKLKFRGGDHEAARVLLDAMTADKDTPLELRRDRCFELGRVHDRLQEPDAAFEIFAEGNALARRLWSPGNAGKDVMLAYIEEDRKSVV
jgi:tetratricopeptide (TPR) repeat protein